MLIIADSLGRPFTRRFCAFHWRLLFLCEMRSFYFYLLAVRDVSLSEISRSRYIKQPYKYPLILFFLFFWYIYIFLAFINATL